MPRIRVELTREQSADFSPFIRNNSSKTPLADLTGHRSGFWPFWCGFLLLHPSDLPDRSLKSWIQWLHVTSPRLSQVRSPWPSLVTPFFWPGTKYYSFLFPYLLHLSNFLQGPAGHAKVQALVPEDSRVTVFRVRCLWFPFEPWLIPSGTTRSKPYHGSTMVWRNLAPYHLFKCLFPHYHALFISKDKTMY